MFVDPKDKAYLSITGCARIIRDASKAGKRIAKELREPQLAAAIVQLRQVPGRASFSICPQTEVYAR